MLRKTGLFCAAAVLLMGCDFLSTREFHAKPAEIRSLSGLSQPGDSVGYRVTETLVNPAGKSVARALSRRRLIFTLQSDSLDGTDTLKLLSLRISDDSDGALLEKSSRLVRFGKDGITLTTASAGGSARFFPLKVAADPASAARANADSIAGADSDSFLALPALLVEGWQETRGMGIFQVTRKQTQVDTLSYQGHLEEAWAIQESVADGDAIVSQGTYWYGVSGLLRADQTWPAFDGRSDDGAKAAGTQLHRVVERL